MNKLAAIIFLFRSAFIFADKPTIKGYYITNNNDTIEANFIIQTKLLSREKEISDIDMQVNIKCLDKGKNVQLLPQEVKKVSFVYQGVQCTYSGVPMTWQSQIGDYYIFLRTEVDGYCKLMLYYQRNDRTGMVEYNYILKKGEDVCYFVASKMLSKLFNNGTSLEEYLSTCEAVKKFMNTKGQSKNYQEFAKIYNSECGG
jgi:hypothetical protein